MTLCDTFRTQSKRTWKLLGCASKIDSPINEETITELLLLYIKKLHQKDLIVKSFNKSEERLNGADWEWWFLNSNFDMAIGWRVQAKRIFHKNKAYDSLKIGKSKGRNQTDVLINSAVNNFPKLAPIFCFYNTDIGGSLFNHKWPCGSYKPDIRLWGCSIADARRVRDAHSNKVQDILSISMPWHCSVCCQGYSASSSLPDRVSGISRLLRTPRFGFDGEVYDEEYDIEPTSELPDYVRALNEFSDEKLHEIAREREISGVVVLKDPSE